MKKIFTTALVLVFGVGILAAQPMQDREERRKEFKEMNQLVENYKNEKNKKKKAAIEEQVKEKVSTNYDRHIKFLEKLVADSEERLAKAKEKLNKANEPKEKAKHIDEVTKKILSGEKPTLFGPPDMEKAKKFDRKDGRRKDGRHHMDRRDCPCLKGPKGGPAPDGEMLPPPPLADEKPVKEEPAKK